MKILDDEKDQTISLFMVNNILLYIIYAHSHYYNKSLRQYEPLYMYVKI